MSKQFLVVANWKSYFTVAQAGAWFEQWREELTTLAEQSQQISIVICPSFESLTSAAQELPRAIALGAQNCSPFEQGPYTGQVTAQSLYQVGCTYCLVGHSELRLLMHETNHLISKKVSRLIDAQIMPVVCIGETRSQHNQGQTEHILSDQLQALTTIDPDAELCIAYEPVWAIGTHELPSLKYLNGIFAFIRTELAKQRNLSNVRILYGGSVNDTTIADVLTTESINGVLIGSASLDFQIFKKIVLSIPSHIA